MSYVLLAILAFIIGYFAGISSVLYRAAKSAAYERKLVTYVQDLIPYFRK